MNFKSKLIISIILSVVFFQLSCSSNQEKKSNEGLIAVNGTELYYKTMGEGTPTFILHGGPGDSYETMLQLAPLADSFKLIFYDQRASSRSHGDEDTASQTIEMFVEDLEQLRLKFTNEKINIIGGSWGTLVGMKYALKYPEHVNKLVLLSPLGYNGKFLLDYMNNYNKAKIQSDSLEMMNIITSDEYKNKDPEALKKFWRVYYRAYFYNPIYADSLHLWFRDSTYAQVPGRYRHIGQFLQTYNLRNELSKITCPTLLLRGDKDFIPIRWIEPFEEIIPNSHLIIIQNAGQWLWVEATDQVLESIREFLNEK